MFAVGSWRWNNRIVASFHQPPEFLDKHVVDKGYIAVVSMRPIVMADFQIDYMAKFLPRERVFCVPHGVDIQYWHAGVRQPSRGGR
jgi:hypothetical protein